MLIMEVKNLRLIARFPEQDQVGFLVDSLKNAGFDRQDMIISDLAQEPESPQEMLTEVPLIKTERDSIQVGETGTFGAGVKGLKGRKGIIVAVELPKHATDQVRAIMEQSGAVEIVQD